MATILSSWPAERRRHPPRQGPEISGGAAWLLIALLLAALLGLPRVAFGQSADNVLLVINENSPASIQIGEYYAKKRSIAADHVVRLKTVATDAISRPEFERSIDAALAGWLIRHDLQDRILYIVLTKGLPLRIVGTAGRDATTASVDSELTLLYRRLLGISMPVLGRIPNPYYLDQKPLADAKPFSRFNSETYLVTRLDAYSIDDAIKLVDRGAAPASDGKIVLDQKASGLDAGGDSWLKLTAARLEQSTAERVVLEKTVAVAATPEPVLGYYSWGSNDPANRLRRFGLSFRPGAIGGMFVSTDGRTLTEPPADWAPSGPRGGRLFGGSFQSLAGDLIRDGITGVSAHVSEPYLDATIRPQILFPAYLAGFNLAESFYLAMPYLSWQTIVIGDPLCQPFPRPALTPAQIAKDIDPDTGVPALFTERRLAGLGADLNVAARKLMVKLEAELASGVRDHLESTLVRVTELEPKFSVADLMLASYYAGRRDFAKAEARYRRVLDRDPDNAVTLNDLAWVIGAEGGRPQDALPLVDKALRLSQRPEILDTAGWIRHLAGDANGGIAYVEAALAQQPGNVEFLIHAAVMHAALNLKARAKMELAAALKIDPKVAERAEVKALQTALE